MGFKSGSEIRCTNNELLRSKRTPMLNLYLIQPNNLGPPSNGAKP